MSLYNFHRVLISAAIVFCFGYGFWSLSQYSDDGLTGTLLIADTFLVLGAGFVAYLVYFNIRLARRSHHDSKAAKDHHV